MWFMEKVDKTLLQGVLAQALNLKQQRPDLFTLTGQPRKRKEEPPVKPQEKTGKGALRGPHHFEYLANRPKNASISEGCLICSKLLECMYARNF
jgi:hypothetical protein